MNVEMGRIRGVWRLLMILLLCLACLAAFPPEERAAGPSGPEIRIQTGSPGH